MTYRPVGLLTLTLMLLAAPASGQMDRAEMAFNFMFRARIAEAAATPGPADDARLARVFLDALDQPNLAPELRQRIIEKAYAFGIKHPDGHDAAHEAIDLLEERQPELIDQWDEQRLRIAELAFEDAPRGEREPEVLLDLYLAHGHGRLERRAPGEALTYYQRAADFATKHLPDRQADVEQAVESAKRLSAVLDEVAQAKTALEANPDNETAAQALLEGLGLALDSPAEAIETLGDRGGPAAASELADMLKLASNKPVDLPEDQVLKLGRWYRERSERPGVASSGAQSMLIRAKLYYSEYLIKHAVEDETRLAAKFELRQVDDALGALGVPPKVARQRVARLAGGGRGHRDPAIDEAIDKGVAWLYEQMDPEKFWEDQAAHNQSRNYAGHTAIAVYALLMAEEDPRTKPALARAIRFLFAADMQGTYAVCFRMHAWELLPDRDRYRTIMVSDANWLRVAQTPEGFFDYTQRPTANPPRRDVSVTLAGALGFWLAQEVAGFDIPQSSWERLASAMIRSQQEDGGWSYKGEKGEVAYGSMTCAGLTSLIVARDHLPKHMHAAADKAIADGMEWLNYQFQPNRNPIRNGWTEYYLAAVQHVGLLTGTRTFNDKDWYQTAADHLVNSQQASGSWGNTFETAFAIAFLTRGGVHLTDSYGVVEEGE